MIDITLPYPPSVNGYWRNFRGRQIISREGRAYRKTVGVRLLGLQGVPLDGRLRVEILATMPDNRQRDVDNLLKALLDGMGHGGVYHDDSQIDQLLIRRGKVKPPGGVQIRVVRLDRDLFGGAGDE